MPNSGSAPGTSTAQGVGLPVFSTFDGSENPLSENNLWTGRFTAGGGTRAQKVAGEAEASDLFGNAGFSYARLTQPAFPADEYVKVDLDSILSDVYIAGRWQSNDDAYVLALEFNGTDHKVHLYRCSSTFQTFTEIAAAVTVAGLTAPCTLELVIVGSRLWGLVNGEVKTTAVDGTISAAGTCGMLLRADAALTEVQVTRFEAGRGQTPKAVAIGTADGSASASGVGGNVSAGAGNAAATSTAVASPAVHGTRFRFVSEVLDNPDVYPAVDVSSQPVDGAAFGTSTAAAIGRSTITATGVANGAAGGTSTGQGFSTGGGKGTAAATSTADGDGRAVARSAGTALVNPSTVESTGRALSGAAAVCFAVQPERDCSFTKQVDAECGCNGAPLVIAACPAGTPQVGVAYSAPLLASGGTPPYIYQEVNNSLPNGISVDPITGIVSGTAAAGGSFSPIYKVTDSLGQAVEIACPFSILQEGSVNLGGWIMEEDTDFLYTAGRFFSDKLRVYKVKKADLTFQTFETVSGDGVYGGSAIVQDATYVYVLCRQSNPMATTETHIVRLQKSDFTTYDVHLIQSSTYPHDYNAMVLDGGYAHCLVKEFGSNRLKLLKVDLSTFAVVDSLFLDSYFSFSFTQLATALGQDATYVYLGINDDATGARLVRFDKGNYGAGPTTLFQNSGTDTLGMAGGAEILVDGDALYCQLNFLTSPLRPRLGKLSISGGGMTALTLGTYSSLAGRRRLQNGKLLALVNEFGAAPTLIEIDPVAFAVTATQALTAILSGSTRDFVLNSPFVYALRCSDFSTTGVNSTVYKILEA